MFVTVIVATDLSAASDALIDGLAHLHPLYKAAQSPAITGGTA